MEEDQEEEELIPLVSRDDTGTSIILESKEQISSSHEGEIHETEDSRSHTVYTTLPVHVQLFEAGPVIQITSTSLVDPASQGYHGVKEKMEVGSEGTCVVGGREVAARGAVTFLTTDGKAYILPQPMASGNGATAEYIIAEDVLSAEDVLQEEQMLTISPPPPSALEFPSSHAQPPDALAIATSEVFNDDYESLTLETQNHISDSRAYHLKVEGREQNNPILASANNFHLQCKSNLQEEKAPTPDASFVTKPPPSLDETSRSLVKIDNQRSANSYFCTRENATSGDSMPSALNEVGDLLNMNVKSVNVNHTDSSVLSKECGVQKELTSKIPLLVNSSKKIAVPEIENKCAKVESENTAFVTTSTALVIAEPQQSENKSEAGSGGGGKVASTTALRRSTRVRRIKKLPTESELVTLEEGDGWKKHRGARAETNSPALWECGSCDAMFRTKGGRDRHLEEGHAFTCYVCGWRGTSKTKYEIHISTVHCHQNARCLACRKDFKNYESYREHMQTSHPSANTPAVKTEVQSDKSNQDIQEEREVEEEGMLGHTSHDNDKDLDHLNSNMSKEEVGSSVGSERGGGGSYEGYRAEQGCPYCGKTFHRRSRFLRHLNYHLGKRSFACKVCNKSFVEKSGLDAHLVTHQPVNAVCSECGKVFKTLRTMKRHLRTHSGRSFPCPVCGKVFKHQESFRVHKATHRQGGSGNQCELCEKDCKTPYYLQLHLSTKHESAKFTCHLCQRSFKWKQSYRKHMAIYHGDAHVKYKCGLCSRHFLTTSELRVHQVIHTNERKHLCHICGKAFKHEYTRDKHVKTVHREDRQHMCPQCGALFKAKSYLDQHLAHVHTTKERVKCKHCNHDFKTESILRSHIKMVHKARSRKYPCQSCSKTFIAPKDLARHAKVHTGVKDYSCPKCQRCFSRKDNMAAHLRTHAAEDSPADSLAYDFKPPDPPTYSLKPPDPSAPLAYAPLKPPESTHLGTLQQEDVTQILGLPSSLSSSVQPASGVLMSSGFSSASVVHDSTSSRVIHDSSSSNIIHNVSSSNIIHASSSNIMHTSSNSIIHDSSSNIIHTPSSSDIIHTPLPSIIQDPSSSDIIHAPSSSIIHTHSSSNIIHASSSNIIHPVANSSSNIHDLTSSTIIPVSSSNIIHTPSSKIIHASSSNIIPSISSSSIIHARPSTSGNIQTTSLCNIIHAPPSPSSNLIYAGPSSSNVIHASSSSSSNIVISENVSLAEVSLNLDTSLARLPAPVASLNNLTPSNGIILSSLPITYRGVPSISTSSSNQAFPIQFSTSNSSVSSPQVCYTRPSIGNLSQGCTSINSGRLVTSSSTCSQNMVISFSRTPQQETYLHPHLVSSSTSLPSTVLSLPSIVNSLPPNSTSLPSTILSIPPNNTSSPVLVPQNPPSNQTPMMCSSFHPGEVVMATEVLSPAASTTTLHHTHPSPHYTQLDAQRCAMSTSSSLNSLGPIVSSCTSVGHVVPASAPIVPPAMCHQEVASSGPGGEGVVVSEPPGTGILLPASSLIHDTTLIIPEKSGVYTLVSEGGKMTPLDSLGLNPVTSGQSSVASPCPPPPTPTPTATPTPQASLVHPVSHN